MNGLTPEQRIARAMAEDAETNAVHARERHLDPAHAHAAPVSLPQQLQNEVRKRLYGPGYAAAANLRWTYLCSELPKAVPFFWIEEYVEYSSAEFEMFDPVTSPAEIISTLETYLLELEPTAELPLPAPKPEVEEPAPARGHNPTIGHLDELSFFKTQIVEASSSIGATIVEAEKHTSEIVLPTLELTSLTDPEVLGDPQAFIALRNAGAIVGCVRKSSIPKEALDNLSFETLSIEEALALQSSDSDENVQQNTEEEEDVAVPENVVEKMEQILDAQQVTAVPSENPDETKKLEPASVYQDSRYAGKSTNVPNGKFSKKGTRG